MSAALEAANRSLQERRKEKPAESIPKMTFNFSEAGLSQEEVAAEAARAEAKRQADEIAANESRFASSGVPARHAGFQPSQSASSEWEAAYVDAAARIGKGFLSVAMGPRGTGKTQLAVCLIRETCMRGGVGAYTKALDVFIALREAFRKEGVTEAAIIKRFVQPNLLVIDAMEERGETPFEDRMLNHIIDKRYDAMRDTLLITNQVAEEFKKSAGASIVSRIMETGSKIECNWGSFRK